MAVVPTKPPKNPPPKNTGCVLMLAVLIVGIVPAMWFA